MPSSKIDQMSLEDLELALSQVRIQKVVANADAARLIRQAFEDPLRAGGKLIDLVADGRVERAIDILGGDYSHWHLGPENRRWLGFFPSRDPDVKAALAQLPEALRSLSALMHREQSLEEGQRRLAVQRDDAEMRRKLTSSDEPAQTLGRKTGQSMV